MDVEARRKVTARVNYSGRPDPSSTTTRYNGSRPPSPMKREIPPSPKPPTARPRAKVNSTATPNSLTRKPSKISTLTLRPVSPAKPSPRFTASAPPKSKPLLMARANGRSVASASTPGTPVSSYPLPMRSKTPSLPASNPGSPHRRTSSVSLLQHDSSSLSVPPSTHGSPVFSSPSSDTFTDSDIRSGIAPKIKSKISKFAKHSDSLSPSPPSARTLNARVRAPSISSSVSMSSAHTSSTSPEHTFYPITTATPAANPYRYGSARAHAPPPHHHYQPFGPKDDSHYSPFTPKVDPTKIPLPPHSPPTSSVSFSSHSSVSHSGESATNGNIRSALDTLLQFSSTTEDDLSDDSSHVGRSKDEDKTRNVRAEAKTNRKIEDLEISNRSLLAINASLEATKHRQAKEIRELKRKLRESRLILPPRAYRAVKSSTDPKDEETDDEEEDEAAVVEAEEEIASKGDELYQRVKALLDGLLHDGKRALEVKPADFAEQKSSGAKVLSAEEVRDWEGPEGEGDMSMRIDPDVSIMTNDDDDEDDLESEDEVAELALPNSDSAPSSPSPGPHILVTPS